MSFYPKMISGSEIAHLAEDIIENFPQKIKLQRRWKTLRRSRSL